MNFFSASDYYKKIFGTKVYKISLDAGCTCPTRDGTKGSGGCIFCSQSGSGDFTADRNLPVSQQIEKARALVDRKLKGRVNSGGKYIAYFQNFTNTYGDASSLEQKYLEALACPDIAGLAVATRPDCLEDEILEKIAAIAENHYVSIELGFQTGNEKTAAFIRRGYANHVLAEAVQRIHKANRNIHVVCHIIFGLPGDSRQDMLESVRFCLNSGTDGLKFTVLHVLEGTDLAVLWRQGKVKTLSMQEYFSILAQALAEIPENIVVHRLTGDGPKKLLLAPLWTADKKKVLNSLLKFLKEC